MSRLLDGFFSSCIQVSLDFCAKKFPQDFTNSNLMVIFTYNLKTNRMEKPIIKPKCEHKRTYVAVRHVSGIQLVKCSDCGAKL